MTSREPSQRATDGDVLVLQLKRLGDLLLALPALAAFRSAAPGRGITLVTEAPFDEVLGADLPVDEVLRHPRGVLAGLDFGRKLGARRFAAAVDFQGSVASARLAWQSGAPVRIGWRLRWRGALYTTAVPRPARVPARHTADQKLDLLRRLGVPLPDAAPPFRLLPTGEEQGAAAETLRALGLAGDVPFLLAAPASRRAYKRWSAPAFAEALDRFRAATGAPVLLAGGPGEEEQLAAVAARVERPVACHTVVGLRRFLALLSSAAAVLAPDGGARQMAEAAGTPTLALFGPQDPGHWTRLSARHRAVSGRRADCRIRCSKRTEPCACLAAMTPAVVAAELVALWQTATLPRADVRS